MSSYIFDLDNTLIYTDLLNNDSYNYALNQVGLLPICDVKRVTRNIVLNKYPYLTSKQMEEIIELKQQYFINNIDKTLPNLSLIKFLKVQNKESCLLWTSADSSRTLTILQYYNINNLFKDVFFSNKINIKHDIKKICAILKCRFDDLIIFEDDYRLIQNLRQLKLNVKSVGYMYEK